MSIGTPTKQASSPSAVARAGSRIIVPGPPKRGISLPPSGWLKVVMAGLLPGRGFPRHQAATAGSAPRGSTMTGTRALRMIRLESAPSNILAIAPR